MCARVTGPSDGTGATATAAAEPSTGKIALVGSPNVGKSVLFSNLTRTYVTVSNYPGTTVEVSRGVGRIGGRLFEVVDTPGMYSLLCLSEEERVARRILLDEGVDLVLHVVDAKNLERMLPMTFQLMEAGLPLILVVNMLDEAEARGLQVDLEALEEELGVPVVGTVGVSGSGMDELCHRIAGGQIPEEPRQFTYGRLRGVGLEEHLTEVTSLLQSEYGVDRRCVALLLLQGDEETLNAVREKEPGNWPLLEETLTPMREQAPEPVEYLVSLRRAEWARATHSRIVSRKGEERETLLDRLSDLLVRPLTGVPILLAVLYVGLYRFVGVFGAGTVVDFLEGTVFEGWMNPVMIKAAESVIPWAVLQDLFVGEYGVLTLGLRYAVAIILPVVTLFFLVFALIEDVGYLPRLALLLDRTFKKIGLSGRAVIPMVLGLGCDTMATMVTRTLPGKRERLIAILLLSLAVPCSAQLAVIMALLSPVPGALLIWLAVVGAVYLGTGVMASRLLPGRAEPFYVEVPPLRLPKLSNVLSKTFARVKWYFKEVLPLFLLASLLIWFGRLTGLFGIIIRGLEFPVRWIGLPAEAAKVFLFGFFRRDYGVAGLYDLSKGGSLTGVQLVVATVALTLFMPCIAQFLMTVKERGWKTGVLMAAGVVTVAFGTAYVLSKALLLTGVTLS